MCLARQVSSASSGSCARRIANARPRPAGFSSGRRRPVRCVGIRSATVTLTSWSVYAAKPWRTSPASGVPCRLRSGGVISRGARGRGPRARSSADGPAPHAAEREAQSADPKSPSPGCPRRVWRALAPQHVSVHTSTHTIGTNGHGSPRCVTGVRAWASRRAINMRGTD